MGPSGTLASDWSYLSYCTKGANTSGNWTKLMNNDALVVNIGYTYFSILRFAVTYFSL